MTVMYPFIAYSLSVLILSRQSDYFQIVTVCCYDSGSVYLSGSLSAPTRNADGGYRPLACGCIRRVWEGSLQLRSTTCTLWCRSHLCARALVHTPSRDRRVSSFTAFSPSFPSGAHASSERCLVREVANVCAGDWCTVAAANGTTQVWSHRRKADRQPKRGAERSLRNMLTQYSVPVLSPSALCTHPP